MSRVNFGSGKDYREGYLNVDIIEGKGDVTGDIAYLSDDFFDEESVKQIILHDVFDHITWVQAKNFMRQCWSWLQENGTVDIHTPNLRYIAEVLAVRDDHEAVKWLYSTDGEGPTNYPSNHSKWGYTPTSLRKLLVDTGFIIIHTSIDCGGLGLWMIGVKR